MSETKEPDGPTDVHQADVPVSKPQTVLLKVHHAVGVCRGCFAEIDWFETAGGRAMPMNPGAKPIASSGQGKNTLGEFLSSDTHWATCPKAGQFHARQGA